MIKSDVLTFGGGGESAVIKCTGDVLSTDTVVANKGSVSKSGRWVTDHFEIGVAEYGTWSVTTSRGSKTSTYSVNVDSLDEFTVTVSYKVYLYNAGDECESVTGGWTAGYKRQTGSYYYGGTGTLTKNASTFTLSTTNTSGYSNVATATTNMIDLTPYNHLCITVDSKTTGNFRELMLQQDTTYASSSDRPKLWGNIPDASLTADIDISSETSTGYIILFWCCADTPTGTATVSKIWLE